MSRITFKLIMASLSIVLGVLPASVFSEPIIITGSMVPAFLGKPLSSLRIVDHERNAIPFQIDQVLPDDDYVCPSGKEPNIGSGKLDSADEIVFLWEDAAAVSEGPADSSAAKHGQRITIGHAAQKRSVYLVDDSTVALSPIRYITYDEQKETFSTPCYNGAFGKNRFHFIRAGVKDFARDSMVPLTNELRVKIYLRALWGLLPISYSENNIVCEVKRYKVGPIRLIRRGDFHLNLGMWMQGSHAAVNQLCYPDMVKVPVYVHLPVRFKSFFSQAYIEMTPVIHQQARNYTFRVPQNDIAFPLNGKAAVDTLIPLNPNHGYMTVDNGSSGYGWLLEASMQETYLDGSGYVFCRPSDRAGLAHCGYRLTVRDLPKGHYLITNWVLFSKSGAAAFALEDTYDCIKNKAVITTEGQSGPLYNQLTKAQKFLRR
jgi:hypothetical protein